MSEMAQFGEEKNNGMSAHGLADVTPVAPDLVPVVILAVAVG